MTCSLRTHNYEAHFGSILVCSQWVHMSVIHSRKRQDQPLTQSKNFRSQHCCENCCSSTPCLINAFPVLYSVRYFEKATLWRKTVCRGLNLPPRAVLFSTVLNRSVCQVPDTSEEVWLNCPVGYCFRRFWTQPFRANFANTRPVEEVWYPVSCGNVFASSAQYRSWRNMRFQEVCEGVTVPYLTVLFSRT